MTTDMLWGMLVIGGLVGWYAGRSVAEYRRAKFDQRRIWDARRMYRGVSGKSNKPPPPPTL